MTWDQPLIVVTGVRALSASLPSWDLAAGFRNSLETVSLVTLKERARRSISRGCLQSALLRSLSRGSPSFPGHLLLRHGSHPWPNCSCVVQPYLCLTMNLTDLDLDHDPWADSSWTSDLLCHYWNYWKSKPLSFRADLFKWSKISPGGTRSVISSNLSEQWWK